MSSSSGISISGFSKWKIPQLSSSLQIWIRKTKKELKEEFCTFSLYLSLRFFSLSFFPLFVSLSMSLSLSHPPLSLSLFLTLSFFLSLSLSISQGSFSFLTRSAYLDQKHLKISTHNWEIYFINVASLCLSLAFCLSTSLSVSFFTPPPLSLSISLSLSLSYLICLTYV